MSIGWLVALNVVYIGDAQQPEWLGPLSVVPVFACVAVLFITDSRQRREAATLAARQQHERPPEA